MLDIEGYPIGAGRHHACRFAHDNLASATLQERESTSRIPVDGGDTTTRFRQENTGITFTPSHKAPKIALAYPAIKRPVLSVVFVAFWLHNEGPLHHSASLSATHWPQIAKSACKENSPSSTAQLEWL